MNNGFHYLLITNKSFQSQDVTMEVDGTKVQAVMNLLYVSNLQRDHPMVVTNQVRPC